MNLTKFTDYSLRVLLYLAERQDRLCRITEIADWYGISKPHLVKIVHQLAQLNYIQSTQGRNGGIRLNMLPSEISIGQIARQTETNFNIVECFDHTTNTCRITNTCSLKHTLHKATDAFLTVLDKTTLASLISPQQNQQGKETK